MEIFNLGDSCLSIQLSNTIDIEISKKTLAIYRLLKNSSELKALGVFDVVPSYNSIALHFDSSESNLLDIKKTTLELAEKIETNSSSQKVNTFEIPVDYNGEDLERIASLNNLSVEEVIQIHLDCDFTVAMIGFTPHFPYLIGLDKRLITPRLSKPRTKIPAGAVAIGGEQAGIYPQASPGGWNILGITKPEILKEIQPGDKIKFRKII